MGKSKKKKNQFKDFQKVKLKVGKKLPRGLNETVATFSTRNIIIKEQLKLATEDQPTTKRKLNINDLLGQCQHYNTTVRHDAVTGLKELLTSHPTGVHKHVGPVLERCSELFMDKDNVVRSTTHKLLRQLFPQISASTMSAFFPVMSAHLCCAMTHIDDDVQQDSLIVIDLLLENFPELLVGGSRGIMSNFIEQISRKTQTSSKGRVQQRSLLINPSSKLSSQKWRNKVLERLEKFLSAYLRYHYVSTGGGESIHTAVEHQFNCTEGERNDVTVLKQWSKTSGFSFKDLDKAASGDVNSGVNLENLVETLVPLLLQCWMEAGPSQLATDLPGNALSSDAMTTLWNVLSVLQYLLELVDKQQDPTYTLTWFAEKHLSDIVHYFVPYFPYSMHEQQLSRKGKGTKTGSSGAGGKDGEQISVKTLNLSVCKILSYYLNQSYSKVAGNKDDWQDKLFSYLTESVWRGKVTSEQVRLIVGIVDKVIKVTDDEEQVNTLLGLSYDVFKSRLQQSPNSSEISTLLRFFDTFAFKKQALRTARYPVLWQWLSMLSPIVPKLLKVQSSNVELFTAVLACLKSAGPLQDKTFLENLNDMLMESVFGTECSGFLKQPMRIEKRLVELVYWLPVMERTHFKQMALFCSKVSVQQDIVYHLLEVLTLRTEKICTEINSSVALEEDEKSPDADEKNFEDRSFESNEEISNFLSFMLSLVVGKPQSVNAPEAASGLWNYQVVQDQECRNIDRCQRRMFLIQVCSRLLVSSSLELSDIVVQYLQKLLREGFLPGAISLLSAVGLLYLLASIVSQHTANPRVVQPVKQLQKQIKLQHLLAAVFQSLVAVTSHNSSSIEEKEIKACSESNAKVDSVNKAEIISGTDSLNIDRNSGSKTGCVESHVMGDKVVPMDISESSAVMGLRKSSSVSMTAEESVCDMLWDDCVLSLVELPELWSGYVRCFCDRLSGISDVCTMKNNCVAMVKLLANKHLVKGLKSENISQLNKTVNRLETEYVNVKEKWMVEFIYEVSLLK